MGAHFFVWCVRAVFGNVRDRYPMFGLPLGSVVTLGVIIALPVAAYGLYRIDRARAGGHVTVFGFRAPDAPE